MRLDWFQNEFQIDVGSRWNDGASSRLRTSSLVAGRLWRRWRGRPSRRRASTGWSVPVCWTWWRAPSPTFAAASRSVGRRRRPPSDRPRWASTSSPCSARRVARRRTMILVVSLLFCPFSHRRLLVSSAGVGLRPQPRRPRTVPGTAALFRAAPRRPVRWRPRHGNLQGPTSFRPSFQ